MAVVTRHDPKPGPDRSFDWSAVDDDLYDGAPDSKTRGMVGWGATEAEAVADIMHLMDERNPNA